MAITLENMTDIVVWPVWRSEEVTQGASIQYVQEVSVRAKAATTVCWHKEEGPWSLTAETLPHYPSNKPWRGQLFFSPKMFGRVMLMPA